MVLFSNNEPTDNYFKLLREVTMNSSNHFAAVNAFAVYANFMASVSEGGDGNFRLWSIKDNKPVLLDLKTETYLNLLKVININFKSLLMLPPKTA